MKRVAIVQSNYIPWKGYFDLIRSVDEFILFDDMQYTRRDWRNRARIGSDSGPRWITIPVSVAGKFSQRIRDTETCDATWPRRHWTSIQHAYARAPHFGEYRERFEALYAGCRETRLSEINQRFLQAICEILEIDTRLSGSWDYEMAEGKTERLVSLCRQAGADEYLSGPAARDYIDPALFEEAGIALRFADYEGYPEYRHLHDVFDHGVSVIDLLFAEGPRAREFMKEL